MTGWRSTWAPRRSWRPAAADHLLTVPSAAESPVVAAESCLLLRRGEGGTHWYSGCNGRGSGMRRFGRFQAVVGAAVVVAVPLLVGQPAAGSSGPVLATQPAQPPSALRKSRF